MSDRNAVCEEFRNDFPAYLVKMLIPSRRVLLEDHLGRCPSCRKRIAELRGTRTVTDTPVRSSSRWVRLGMLAAAGSLLIAIGYVGRDTIDVMMAPGGPRATVVSAEGGLFSVAALSAEARSAKVAGAVQAGAAIGERDSVRTGPGARAVLQLAGGSRVDVNERTELFVTAAWSGETIHLQRGDIVVNAAQQRPRGSLRVLTRDSITSVKGTVFAVSVGVGGSVVSVVEGSAAVNQRGKELLLGPGDQAASIPALASSAAQAVSWSPDSQQLLERLASVVKIEQERAKLPEGLRSKSALLAQLPAGAGVYGAVPNPGLTIGRALALAQEQSTPNAMFGAWWNSASGQALSRIADRIEPVSPLLGEEIVFSVSVDGSSGSGELVPLVMARVQRGKRAELATAVERLFAPAGEPASFAVFDDLIVVSDSPSHLAWATAHLGQGAGSPFAAAISERYQRGVGWLIGLDAASHYVFLEQRAPAGAEENEVTFAFQGRRTGMASWLAGAGSGGATEYLPADALVAGYVSMREPLQMFEELAAQMTRSEPQFASRLSSLKGKLGAGFVQNLTAAVGTEAALALTGFSTGDPVWVMASLANNPAVIDSSIQSLVDTFNAELGPDEQFKQIVFEQQIAGDGRKWSRVRTEGLPLGITWTYDAGHMVAGTDRTVVERAIAARHGGSPLVWSSDFLGQLPSSGGLHPSAFAWLNTKGDSAMLSPLAPSPALGELMARRDPILVMFDGSAEQIRAASRTRISGLIMDLMLIESLGRVIHGQSGAR